jgi:hypothetical protein
MTTSCNSTRSPTGHRRPCEPATNVSRVPLPITKYGARTPNPRSALDRHMLSGANGGYRWSEVSVRRLEYAKPLSNVPGPAGRHESVWKSNARRKRRTARHVPTSPGTHRHEAVGIGPIDPGRKPLCIAGYGRPLVAATVAPSSEDPGRTPGGWLLIDQHRSPGYEGPIPLALHSLSS